MGRTILAGITVLAVLLSAGGPILAGQDQKQYSLSGMVLSVGASGKSFVVSHDSIPGVMPAMTMQFDVQDPVELKGVTPGALVDFVLLVRGESAHAERIRVRQYTSVEQDPLTARRLKLLRDATRAPAAAATRAVSIGQPVPDFTLLDQARQPVTLSQLRGKVVAVTFIYTSCVLPQFCYRMANQFGALQHRFAAALGRDLVLLTISFDPVRDQPERLAEYASQWNADAGVWHFLTGTTSDVQRVCALFGLDAFPDEGLITHSTRTAIIDRRGVLHASIEGNQFTAAQLGDLVQAALKQPTPRRTR